MPPQHLDRAAPLIVLVEDHPETRDILRAVLELAGYRVQAAQNGLEGLRAVQSAHPALVITDLMMPVLDGLTLLHALRETWGHSIPVILVSSYSAGIPEGRAVEDHFDAALRKPVTPSELLATVNHVLDGP